MKPHGFQFPALLSVFPWQAIGTPLCPLPNQALHGSWAESPGELDSRVRRAGLFLPVSCVMRQCDPALPGSGPGPAWTCFHAQVLEPATILSPSTPTPNPNSFQNGRTNFPSDGGETAAVEAGNSSHAPELACVTLPLHLPVGQI